MQFLSAILKGTEWFWFISKANHTHHGNLSLFLNHRCWRSRSWPFLWRPRRPSRTNTPKKCPFHHRGLECKSRKSRDTGSNRQVWSWNTKWIRTKANRVLSRKHVGHKKVPFFNNPREDSIHEHHQIVNTEIILLYSLQPKMEKLYRVSKNKTGSWLWLRPWAIYCQIQT